MPRQDEVWDTKSRDESNDVVITLSNKTGRPEMHEEKPWEHITHVPTTPPAI
jgi:hypothetical protein